MPRFHPRHECPTHGCCASAFCSTSDVCERCVCYVCGLVSTKCCQLSHRWAFPVGAYPAWDEVRSQPPVERKVIAMADTMRLFLRDPIDLEVLRNTEETYGPYPISSMAEYLEHGDAIGEMIALLDKAGATTAWYARRLSGIRSSRVVHNLVNFMYRQQAVERVKPTTIARADAVEFYFPVGRVVRLPPCGEEALPKVPREPVAAEVPAVRGVQHTPTEAAMLAQMLHVADHGIADHVWDHDVEGGLCPARSCGDAPWSYVTLSPELDDARAAVLSPNGVDARVLFLSLVRARPAARRYDGGGVSALVVTCEPEWWLEALSRFPDLKVTGSDTRDALSVTCVPPHQVDTTESYGHVMFDGAGGGIVNDDGSLSTLGVRLADLTAVTKWAIGDGHAMALLLLRKGARMGSLAERAVVCAAEAHFITKPIAPPLDAVGGVELVTATVRVQDVDFAEAFESFSAGIEEVGEMWPDAPIPDLTIACNGGKGFRLSGAYSVAAAAAVGAGNETCPICMGTMLTSRRPVRTSCGHTFCHSCIDEWQRKGRGCPVCRHLTLQPMTRVERPPIASLAPLTTFAPSTAKLDAICEEIAKADVAERLVVVASYPAMRDQLRARFPTVPIVAPTERRSLYGCESVIVCDPKCGLSDAAITRAVAVHGKKRWVRLNRFILQDVEV
jgi:hypothetical protein